MSPDYTVHLEQVFQGPMDLLLHLVREQEVEIQEIEIAKVVEGYLAYLNALEELDIEHAGDFLVMAATLMAIKARSLLPHEQLDLEEELDPKDELIQRLLEYRRFKGAADDLQARHAERARLFPRGWRGEARPEAVERELDLAELTVWDLLSTFSRLMRETLADQPHKVAGDPRPLRFYVEAVVERLGTVGSTSLRRLCDSLEEVPSREALVGSFCALLELVRLELVELEQEAAGTDIRIAIRQEHRGDIGDVVRESLLDEEDPAQEEAAPTTPAGWERGDDGLALDEEDEDAEEEDLGAEFELPPPLPELDLELPPLTSALEPEDEEPEG